jgi:ABC-type Zn2+ transport system substrate-binding protein/surface adhesin
MEREKKRRDEEDEEDDAAAEDEDGDDDDDDDDDDEYDDDDDDDDEDEEPSESPDGKADQSTIEAYNAKDATEVANLLRSARLGSASELLMDKWDWRTWANCPWLTTKFFSEINR